MDIISWNIGFWMLSMSTGKVPLCHLLMCHVLVSSALLYNATLVLYPVLLSSALLYLVLYHVLLSLCAVVPCLVPCSFVYLNTLTSTLTLCSGSWFVIYYIISMHQLAVTLNKHNVYKNCVWNCMPQDGVDDGIKPDDVEAAHLIN